MQIFRRHPIAASLHVAHIAALMGLGTTFTAGLAAAHFDVFPYPQIMAIRNALRQPLAEAPEIHLDDATGDDVAGSTAPDLPPVTYRIDAECFAARSPIATEFGNNHDAVYLTGRADTAYPHHLIVSGDVGTTQLYGAETLGAAPNGWTLIDPAYHVAEVYELDDGILIDGRYYIFEDGRIYTTTADPAAADGAWDLAGGFPDMIEDVAVHYDGATLHLFGEYGDFAGRPDGTSIAHVTGTPSDLSTWHLAHTAIANPNTRGTVTWGVGDPSLIQTDAGLLMVTDIEADGVAYHIALWRAEAVGQTFDFAGILAAPDPGTEGLANHHVQDGDVAWTGANTAVMFANWRDVDGTPGRALEGVDTPKTRVVGGYTCDFAAGSPFPPGPISQAP